MFFVYILLSYLDKKYYIGQTNNIEDRLHRHNAGYVNATRHRVPFELLVFFEFATRSEAMMYEKYLKSLKGGNTFQLLIAKK